jgi:sulfur dioxygenase
MMVIIRSPTPLIRTFFSATISSAAHNLRTTKNQVKSSYQYYCRTSVMAAAAAPQQQEPNQKMMMMGFAQLFDEDSSTYTYLLWDDITKDAIIVDPVDIQVDRDIAKANALGLQLRYGVNTHAHADHITGTYLLKQRVPGLQSIISTASCATADLHVTHGDRIEFGRRFVSVRATPGHTDGCVSYLADDESFVLTGDALLIQGCGRTDFQQGDASKLYDSVHQQLFTLPDDTVVYPAHDYLGRSQTTIGVEKTTNPRFGGTKTKEEFIQIMANLNLPYPKHIDAAVPANLRCGVPDVPKAVSSS